ncbi:hypothetical protein EDD17DRAFT_1517253 [Pisolithus thermaeus]|nr:hypothetical protein EDD17DRAFT_1517253 [Pisolithus thermaeus]
MQQTSSGKRGWLGIKSRSRVVQKCQTTVEVDPSKIAERGTEEKTIIERIQKWSMMALCNEESFAMVAFISSGLFELVVVVVERSVPLVHDGVQLRQISQLTKLPQKRVMLSGIQNQQAFPTSVRLYPVLIQLGNYPGALSNSVKVQKTTEPADTLPFSIVGWLALTLPQDPATLRSGRDDMLATLLAIGLDPERSIVFHQDSFPNCLTPAGKLRRVATWKVGALLYLLNRLSGAVWSLLATSGNASSEDDVDESLSNSADARDSRASHVLVGEDQQQHVELTRDLAEIFDRAFSGLNMLGVYPTWMESESLFSALATLRDTLPTPRVVQLTNPVDVARLSTTHYYEMAVRTLEKDLAQCAFRIEDHDGNLLLARLEAVGFADPFD